MRVFTEAVTATGMLTGYVQDRSRELSNASLRPAVLILPGGGYLGCSDREAEPVALAYLAEGFNAFVLRYATGEAVPWQESFDDGRAALAWIRAHAGDLDLEVGKVAVVGFSAGGHLAASLGTLSGDRPDALVLGYPVTLAEAGELLGKHLPDIPDAVGADTPPTFLFSTCGDALVPIRHSIALLAALAEHQVPFESHIYLLGRHGLSLAKPLTADGKGGYVEEAVAQWQPDSVRFLRRVFGDFPLSGARATYASLSDRGRVGLDMPITALLADERAAAVVGRWLPDAVSALREDPFADELTLRDLEQFGPLRVDAATLDGLGRELGSLKL